jgi:hypothetical protein
MTEGARELLIRTEQTHSDAVLVSVQDSGSGFPPESAQRLFESFYTTKPGGLGMGLSICHSIIEAHQGRLWASANLPRGAVFHLTLPALLSAGARSGCSEIHVQINDRINFYATLGGPLGPAQCRLQTVGHASPPQVERFTQEADGPRVHCFRSNGVVRVCSYENDGYIETQMR